MYIHWIEIRHKDSGFMLKHSDFDTFTSIGSTEEAFAARFIDMLAELRLFALGTNEGLFADYICRVSFTHDNARWLWYCKTDRKTVAGETVLIVDEEELYTEDDRLLFSRNAKGIEWFVPPTFTALNPTTSALKALGMPELLTAFDAFRCMHVMQVHDAAAVDRAIDTMQTLRLPATVILDARQAIDLPADSTWRSKVPEGVQVLLFHSADGAGTRHIVAKRNGMSLA